MEFSSEEGEAQIPHAVDMTTSEKVSFIHPNYALQIYIDVTEALEWYW